MKNNFIIILFFLILVLFCNSIRAQTKIAVIPDKGLENYADLLTIELSKQKDLNVIERAEIERIFKEQEISSKNLSANYLKLGKLLGTDGLVFLKKIEYDGKKFIGARLVSVNVAAVVGSCVYSIDDSAKITEWAEMLKWRFLPFIPKLKIPKEECIAVSILNIRSFSGSLGSLKAANLLTTLLSHRLMLEQNMFVLERFNMKDVLWEKNLDDEKTNPFWTGSYSLEGNTEKDKGIVSLKIVLKKNDGTVLLTFEENSPDANIAELVDKSVSKIAEVLSKNPSAVKMSSDKEAEMFFKEAQWAYNCGLFDIAQNAADVSYALGRRSADIYMLRIKSYSCANNTSFKYTSSIPGPWWKPEKPIDTMLYVMDLYASFLCEAPAETLVLDPRSQENWSTVGAQIIFLSSYLILQMHDSGAYREPEALEKLETLQKSVCASYAMTVKKAGTNYNNSHLKWVFSNYFPYWNCNLDDTLNEYRKMVSSSKLDDLNYLTLKKPFIIWTDDKKQVEKANRKWCEFVDSYLKSDKFTESIKGYMLGVMSDIYPDKEKTLFRDSLELLWKNKDKIDERDLMGCLLSIEHYRKLGKKTATDESREICLEFIKHILALLDEGKFYVFMPDSLLTCLYNLGDGYSAKQLEEIRNGYDKARRSLYATPTINGEAGCLEFEKKIEFMSSPMTNPGIPDAGLAMKISPSFDAASLASPERKPNFSSVGNIFYRAGRMWGVYMDNNGMNKYSIFNIKLVDNSFRKTVAGDPFDTSNTNSSSGDGAFYLDREGKACVYSNELKKKELSSKLNISQWAHVETNMVNHKMLVGYTGHEAEKEKYFSAIFEIDTADDKVETLANSIRRPALNILDDEEHYQVNSVFYDSKETPYSLIEFGDRQIKLFSYNRKDKTWNVFFDFPGIDKTTPCDKGILLYNTRNIWLFEHGGHLKPLYMEKEYYNLKKYEPILSGPYNPGMEPVYNNPCAYDGKNLYVLCYTKKNNSSEYFLKVIPAIKGAGYSLIPLSFIGLSDEERKWPYLTMIDAGEYLVFKNSIPPTLWIIPKSIVLSTLEKRLPKPEIICDNTLFIDSFRAMIKSSPGTEVRYTLDGSVPGVNSTVYSEPLSITETVDLNVRAFSGDNNTSDMASVRLTKARLLEAVEAKSNFPAGISYYFAALPDERRGQSTFKCSVSKDFDFDEEMKGKERFSLDVSGYIKIPENGIYKFFLQAGGAVYFNLYNFKKTNKGNGVFEPYRVIVSEAPTEAPVEGKIGLKKGYHRFGLIYHHKGGPPSFSLMIEGPGMERKQLPPEMLFY